MTNDKAKELAEKYAEEQSFRFNEHDRDEYPQYLVVDTFLAGRKSRDEEVKKLVEAVRGARSDIYQLDGTCPHETWRELDAALKEFEGEK